MHDATVFVHIRIYVSRYAYTVSLLCAPCAFLRINDLIFESFFLLLWHYYFYIAILKTLFCILKGLLRKEIDKIEASQYFGIECDSDEEMNEDESDVEYFSEDETSPRKAIDYDLDKMFEIVKKRDFNKWSMQTINTHYRKISPDASGRMQITRYFF